MKIYYYKENCAEKDRKLKKDMTGLRILENHIVKTNRKYQHIFISILFPSHS